MSGSHGRRAGKVRKILGPRGRTRGHPKVAKREEIRERTKEEIGEEGGRTGAREKIGPKMVNEEKVEGAKERISGTPRRVDMGMIDFTEDGIVKRDVAKMEDMTAVGKEEEDHGEEVTGGEAEKTGEEISTTMSRARSGTSE